MFGVVPGQNVGIHAFIPMCDTSNSHMHSGLHIVPETHVYKENKLKIAKHPGALLRCQQFNATDLSKKLSNGFVDGHSNLMSNTYGSLNKKRKADEANLHTHDEFIAPQSYCRYVPASPVLLHHETVNRVVPVGCLPMHRHLPQLAVCSSSLLNTSSSNVPSTNHCTSQTAMTTVSKANPKPSTTQGDYTIVVGEVLRSSNESYEVLAFLGRGTFGQVVKCRSQSTRRCVAIKILKNLPSYLRQGNVEIQILQTLSQQDTESHNIVRAIECFQHRNHMCFVFELLEQNLYEYLKSNKFRPLSLPEIRPIAQQVLTALSKLKSLGLIHADLKPENIMLVSSTNGALRYRVKVIDFGSACHSSKAVQNTYLQSRYYRAPEILLGLPFNEAIDMWSLGCVIAELFLGWPLYPGSSEYDQMRYIVETQGLPPPDLLQKASKFNSFFVRDPYQCELRLKTQQEYALETGQQAKEARKYFFTSLNQICEVSSGLPGPDDPDLEFEQQDRQQFANLLAQMLKLRPLERVVPDAALAHPFITLSHLQTLFPFSKRFHESVSLMQVCHEASRRKQQHQQQLLLHAKGSSSSGGVGGGGGGSQYHSTISLNEQPVPHTRLPRSALASPTTLAATSSNPSLFTHDAFGVPIPVPQSSTGINPTGTAVAYYAAAAVAAAALTKPTGVGRQTDPCYFRQNHVPVLLPDTHVSNALLDRAHLPNQCTTNYPASSDYPDYPAAAAAAAAVLMAQQKSRTVGVRTRQSNSALMHHVSAVPRSSLSLYDLVTAGGSALSLLNAAVSAATVAPAQSNSAMSTGLSATQSHTFPNHFQASTASASYDCLHQLGQPLQPKYSKPEPNNRLSSCEAEHAALVLSSYLGREQPMSMRSGGDSLITATGDNSELCDTLHAFVHHHQQQQQHLCRNSVAQQQTMSLSMRQQHQQPLLLASDLSVAVDDPCRSRELTVLVSQSTGLPESACQSQQIYHPYSRPLGPLQSHDEVTKRGLTQSELQQQQQQQQQFARQIPCAQFADTAPHPSPHLVAVTKPTSGGLFVSTALDVMPINLVTSDAISLCSDSDVTSVITNGSSRAQPLWCSRPNGTKVEEQEIEKEDRIPHDLSNSRTSIVERLNVFAGEDNGNRTSPDVKPGSLQTSGCQFLTPSTDAGVVFKAHRSAATLTTHANESLPDMSVSGGSIKSDTFSGSGLCKSSGDQLTTPTHSCSTGQRSDKKIPVGRVQPMIKQEDVSSTVPSSSSRFIVSPVSMANFRSGTANAPPALGPAMYVNSPQLVAPCVVRNAYQTVPRHPSPDPTTVPANCPGFRKPPSHLPFTRPDQQSAQSTRHLSAAHAAAAAYHNLMFFQLQQQQQQQQQQLQHHAQRQLQQHQSSQLTSSFPTVSNMHPIHLAAAAAAAVSTHSCVQTVAAANPIQHTDSLSWSATSSAVAELDDPAAAAAASYYAAAAAAAAAAVAQHGQQQQLQHHYHRQELEQLLFDPHSMHLGAQLTAAEHCQLGAQLLRQQQQQHPFGKF